MARKTNRLGCCSLATLGLFSIAPAHAGEDPLAFVRLSGELVDEVVQGLLPATVAAPRDAADGEGRPLRLLGVRYCGPGEKGVGRLRGLAAWGRGEAAAAISCAGSLGEWAERARPAFPEGTLLVDLDAGWKRWELTLTAARAVIIGKKGQHRPASGFEKRVELATVSTADLRIDTGKRPIVLHAIPAFHDRTVEVGIVLGDKAPTRPPRLPAGRADLPKGANCAAELSAAFANQILRLLTAQQPVSIPLQGDQVDIANVTLAGAGAGENARLTLAGTAEPRSLRESTQWTLVAAGEPLRVSSVQMVAQYEDCSSLGTIAAMACKVRNGARAAAAEAFARALTERYQTQLVHELVSPVSLGFTIAGQRIRLYGDLLNMSFGAGGLSAGARLSGK